MVRSVALIGLKVVAALPFRLCHAIGYCLGNLLYWIPNDARRITRINLRLSFPDLSAADRARLERRSLIQLMRGVFELGALWLWSGDRLLSLVRDVEGLEQLRDALGEGRGVIMLTPHLGAFEMIGLYCGYHFGGTSLYRPIRIGLGEDICRWRSRLGNRLVPTNRRGVIALRRALERGEGVGILPDQDPPRDGGLYAPFFGIETYTITLPSRLAISTGAVVMVIVAERLPWGGGFRISCRRATNAIRNEPVEASVAAMNREIEAMIREIPAQYVWSYKRFKTRPPGVAKRY